MTNPKRIVIAACGKINTGICYFAFCTVNFHLLIIGAFGFNHLSQGSPSDYWIKKNVLKLSELLESSGTRNYTDGLQHICIEHAQLLTVFQLL